MLYDCISVRCFKQCREDKTRQELQRPGLLATVSCMTAPLRSHQFATRCAYHCWWTERRREKALVRIFEGGLTGWLKRWAENCAKSEGLKGCRSHFPRASAYAYLCNSRPATSFVCLFRWISLYAPYNDLSFSEKVGLSTKSTHYLIRDS